MSDSDRDSSSSENSHSNDRSSSNRADQCDVTLRGFQQLIRDMYYEKDAARGIEGTFMWLTEEFGELASALRDGTHQQRREEFADVLAWLVTIANIVNVDLDEAVRHKYASGCPGCRQLVCSCDDAEKP